MDTHGSLWAIVLAGGDGTRLASLTEQLYGEPLPKQFAVLAGDRSLLQATIDRLLPLVPPSRTVIVVPLAYEALAREQVAKRYGMAGPVHIVVQPANRGTGPGVMLPLAHVLALDPHARVVVAPSDHHYRDADSFRSAVSAAARQTATVPLTLVGAEADHAETEYGWIEPGESLGDGMRRVARFIEKPSAPVARELYARGFLWNTFTMVAAAARLWEISEGRMPVQATLIHACVARNASKGRCLARAYDAMESVSFSRAVLERTADLGVVSAPGCGFSDWGSPARVAASLRGTPDLDRLMSRITSRSSTNAGGFRDVNGHPAAAGASP
jgi:mannose-1-phosphate guanylyltransferase